MIQESFPVGAFQCNCTILADEGSGEAVVIDPGAEAERVIAAVRANGLKPVALIHTHAHLDHVGGTRRVKEETGAPILLHKGDEWLYDNLVMQASMFRMAMDDPLPVDRWLEDGGRIAFGRHALEVIHTPGHTPGSICFRLAGPRDWLFSGDTLFQRSIGRTDLWGGDYDTIIRSIASRLLPLVDDTVVLPGHGPKTTIGDERKKNPFLRDL